MNFKKFLWLALSWLIAVLIGASIGTTIREHNCRLQMDGLEQKNDTVEIRDTVYMPAPAHVRQTVIRSTPAVLSIDSSVTAKSPDSAAVMIPVVQKEYADSNYHAWVSGGSFVSLDSIWIFQRQKYITHTVYDTPVHKKNKRWGIGVQAGYGWNGKGFSPYVGVGVTYILWGW